MAKTRNGVIAALDIGTSKVVCFVARVDGQGLRVVGIGHQPAQGMRSGNIVDMEAATRAISSAVSTAEEMCGEHVREVIVGVSGGSAASHNQSLDVAIGHHEIGERDVRRVQQHIHLPAETADRDIIHSEAIGFSVDGTPVRDARGMFGEDLLHGGADLRRTAHHGRAGQRPAQALDGEQRLVKNLRGDGQHPALRIGHEAEAVHVADRHIDDLHRLQRHHPPVERRLAAAALDQQHLVQPSMTVHGEGPVVQHRARRDGFAMHDVGQVAGLAEQIVDADRRGCASHVRIVQDNGETLHRSVVPNLQKSADGRDA